MMEMIRQQLKETPEKSDRQIADGLGVSHNTEEAQRKKLESTGQIDQLDTRVGADGKQGWTERNLAPNDQQGNIATSDGSPLGREILHVVFSLIGNKKGFGRRVIM